MGKTSRAARNASWLNPTNSPRGLASGAVVGYVFYPPISAHWTIVGIGLKAPVSQMEEELVPLRA